MELQHVQNWFQKAVINPSGSEPQADASHLIEGRLGIYQNAYSVRIVEALQEDFKVLYRAMGEEAFTSCIERYLKFYPSTYFNISDTGRHLSQYLKATDYEKELPFLSELANLEWALIESFWAEHKVPVTASTFEGLQEDKVSKTLLTLSPWVRLLHYLFPVHSILENFEKDDETFFRLPDPVDTHLLVFREGHLARVLAIEPLEFEALCHFKTPCSLEEMASFLEARPIAGKTLQTWFSRWVSLGLLCK